MGLVMTGTKRNKAANSGHTKSAEKTVSVSGTEYMIFLHLLDADGNWKPRMEIKTIKGKELVLVSLLHENGRRTYADFDAARLKWLLCQLGIGSAGQALFDRLWIKQRTQMGGHIISPVAGSKDRELVVDALKTVLLHFQRRERETGMPWDIDLRRGMARTLLEEAARGVKHFGAHDEHPVDGIGQCIAWVSCNDAEQGPTQPLGARQLFINADGEPDHVAIAAYVGFCEKRAATMAVEYGQRVVITSRELHLPLVWVVNAFNAFIDTAKEAGGLHNLNWAHSHSSGTGKPSILNAFQAAAAYLLVRSEDPTAPDFVREAHKECIRLTGEYDRLQAAEATRRGEPLPAPLKASNPAPGN